MRSIEFGEAEPGRRYEGRQAAFGVVQRDGLIAVAAITVHPGQDAVFDLPGGGIDPGESEVDALMREFGEETGLCIAPGPLLVRASQLFVNPQGRAVNNHGAFYAGRMVGEDATLKIEADHDLIWMPPADFIRLGRHEAQAWAVCIWLRQGFQSFTGD